MADVLILMPPRSSEPAKRPLLYLDLDGTVRKGRTELGRFVNKASDVLVFPEAVTMMRRWKEEVGGLIAAVSNQGGVAMGHMSLEDCVASMFETNRQAEAMFDVMLYCPHRPDGSCWCRKPAPGMLIESATLLAAHGRTETSCVEFPPDLGLMVGDREEDEEAARLAGVSFITAAEWRAQGVAPAAPATTDEETSTDARTDA